MNGLSRVGGREAIATRRDARAGVSCLHEQRLYSVSTAHNSPQQQDAKRPSQAQSKQAALRPVRQGEGHCATRTPGRQAARRQRRRRAVRPGGAGARRPTGGLHLPRATRFNHPTPTPQLATTQGHRWSLFQGSQDVPWGTQGGGVVGLTVLQPKFLEQFPNARFHFKKGRLAQQGTFKGVWLNEEHTEWALERLEE